MKGNIVMIQVFQCPTKIYMCEDGLKEAGTIIKDLGYKKVFVLIGGGSVKKLGLLERLENSLKENEIEYVIKGGIEPNPDISFVRENLPYIREYSPDLILAFGGGSVIDTAKNIIHSYFYEGDPLDFNRKTYISSKVLPLGVILTLSASGSEMSSSCVMSSREDNFKQGFNHVTNYPTFSILDPKLTYSVNRYQTACGIVDIISHSFERYFSSSSRYELSDNLALGVIRDVVDLTKEVLDNPESYEARRSMMLAGAISHNGITSFGKTHLFRCHFVEHQLSAKYPLLTHGLGLRFLLNEYLKINRKLFEEKILKFGKFVFDIDSTSVDDTIERFESYLTSLGLPNSLEEYGLSKEERDYYINQLILN